MARNYTHAFPLCTSLMQKESRGPFDAAIYRVSSGMASAARNVVSADFSDRYGKTATILVGPPLPFSIVIGSAMMVAPVGGR